MIEQQFRIAEIEVAKSPTDEKIVGLFRYEGNGQQRKNTTLLIIAEITSTLYVYERLIDVINGAAEQTRHLMSAVEQDPVMRFEKLIQQVNEAVARFLEGEPTPLAWNRVNMFLMELSQDHICLAGHGRLMNVFLQKQEDGSYRTFDLFGSLEQPVDVDPKKAFASLICGDMKPGDLLIAGTQNLDRLRNELRIRERLTTLPPVSAALEIKQDLERRGIPDDFVAAVVACCALEMPSAIASKVAAIETDKSTASINKLRDAEKEAIQHLSPAITPSTKPQSIATRPGLRPVMAGISGVMGFLQTLRSRLPSLPTRNKDVAMLASLRGLNAGHGSSFSGKRKRNAIMGGAALVVVILGISIYRYNQAQAREAAAWNATFAEIQDNRDRAESDLVYANDARARRQIETAETLLASLDVRDKDNQKKVDDMKSSIAQLRERLRKITVAEPVTELAALTGVPDGTLTAPVLVKDAAYAVDNSTHVVLKVDVTNKTIKRISLPSGADAIVAGSLGSQSVVFTTAKGKFYAVNTQTDAVSTLATQPRASSTADLVIYANRAYSLDGPNGQIWRASSVGGGFGSEQTYIKASNATLQGAIALAIDSNVYVLKPDGSLARFLSGGQEGFTLTTIDPPLRAASGIWTHVDATRIAITDPAEKRVVVFNKDGSLKAQLTSTQFTGPRDLDADEATKRLLLVDGARLLLVPLP